LIAICPQPGSTCEQVAAADLVFIAEVVEKTSYSRTDEQGQPVLDGINSYRFNVLEGFKGTTPGDFRPQFYFGIGQNLDSFHSGRRYLIFATRTETGIYRSGCSLSREITKTGEGEWLPKMRAELGVCPKQR
jgi:hypothetical protein